MRFCIGIRHRGGWSRASGCPSFGLPLTRRAIAGLTLRLCEWQCLISTTRRLRSLARANSAGSLIHFYGNHCLNKSLFRDFAGLTYQYLFTWTVAADRTTWLAFQAIKIGTTGPWADVDLAVTIRASDGGHANDKTLERGSYDQDLERLPWSGPGGIRTDGRLCRRGGRGFLARAGVLDRRGFRERGGGTPIGRRRRRNGLAHRVSSSAPSADSGAAAFPLAPCSLP